MSIYTKLEPVGTCWAGLVQDKNVELRFGLGQIGRRYCLNIEQFCKKYSKFQLKDKSSPSYK